MSTDDWRVPPSVLAHLEQVPRDRPVVLLLRHSVRDPLPAGDAGNELPITELGRRLARDLGCVFGARLRTLRTSPVLRCVQTADALLDGAGVTLPIEIDRTLGDPGAFVIEGELAWQNWQRLGHEGVMRHLVTETSALPGMARPGEAARSLVHHMLTVGGTKPGLHVFVSHDSVVAATAARLLEQALEPADWPCYLEGAFFFVLEEELHTVYRNRMVRSRLGRDGA